MEVTMQLYKSYVFKDKDPIIDKLRTIFRDEGLDIKTVAADSGVHETTIYAWLYGVTKRPQHASLKAVFNACGFTWEPKKAVGAAAVSTLRSVS
jgi:transcriptional regulator with XRE-family HTH domain